MRSSFLAVLLALAAVSSAGIALADPPEPSSVSQDFDGVLVAGDKEAGHDS